jgi:hypothetical protein
MRPFPRRPDSRSRSFVGRRRYRLLLEPLESRLTPAAVGVDAAANVHAIDPNVYGSAFATAAQIADLRLPLNRNGGNASDTYSLAQDATNHGSDWYFESIALGAGNGQGMDSFVSATKAGGAQPSVTLNLFDWAAKLGANRSLLGSFGVSKYGPQQSTDPFWPNWGNGLHADGTDVTGNDPNDAYVANSPAAQQAWVQHLIGTFGNSQNGGVKYYSLGNEPGLWNSTHRDIHPAGDTLPELRDRIIAAASAVKASDPGAKILGPEEWGWTNYFISGADAAAQNWGATYGGLNAEAWLLDQLRQHDAATGQRLLDYFTLHFYPQAGQFSDDVSTNMRLLRNRSTRSLWDPNYVDESWIGSTGINGGKVNLINLMKGWVNTYYPGTKLGLTEYNWGAEGDMNGATTQADIWGIFGREGLDLADRWTTPATGSPTYLAMKMFRNYDGNGSAFGNTSVRASVGNPDQVDAFASARSSDGALTVMVVNKNLFDPANPSATTPVTLSLSNCPAGATAGRWQLAAVDPSNQAGAAISHLADVAVSGNGLSVTVPMESVTLFVIRPAPYTISGRTMTVHGTAGNDTYAFYAGTNEAFTLNGTTYPIDRTAIDTVIFQGNGGTDTATLVASGTGNVAALYPNSGQLRGSGYVALASGVAAVYAAGGPTDQAYFADSAGADTLVATPAYAYLQGAGFLSQANGFGYARADSTAGGADLALLYDSAGDDTLVGTPAYASLQGPGHTSFAAGFKSVRAYASSGNDNAYLYDSAGDDTLVGTPAYSYLQGAGYLDVANGFDSVRAYASSGNDTAYLYDSAGNDLYYATAAYAYLQGAGFLNVANGFKRVNAYSSGGSDQAYLIGTNTSADTYVNAGGYAYLFGSGFLVLESGFAFLTVNPFAKHG